MYSPSPHATPVNRAGSTIWSVLKLLLLLSVASVVLGQTADFFVSPDGNDSATGTLAAPFATVDRARLAVRNLKQNNPGRNTPIVVMLRGGTYYLTTPLSFSTADSGTPQAGIVYQNFPGETPVISGGQPVTGLQQTSFGTWTASIPASFQNFEQLFVNGQRRYRPRTTKSSYLYNTGPVYVASATPACPLLVAGKGYECFDRFQFKGGDIAASYANINDVEIDDFEKWTMSKMRLQSVDTANNVAILTGSTSQDENHGFIAGHRYLIENVKEALSQSGEWYLDRGTTPWTLTYIAMPGEDLSTAAVEAPQLPQIVIANNLSYVSFRGLTFSHDNWVVPAAGHASTQDEPKVTAAVSFTNSSYITFNGCIFAHTGGWAVEFEGAGAFSNTPVNEIINSEFYDLGTGGPRIGNLAQQSDTDANVAQYSLLQNNTISGGGRILPAGVGIFLGNSHNNTVTHNDIFDFYHSGIEVCFPTPANCPLPHDNLVSFNHVWQIGQGVTSDMGGIYVATYTTSGNKILNNKIHDVTHDFQDADGYGGEGIYLDNNTSNVLVQNNLVYRTSQSTYFNNMGANNMFSNNILALGRLGMVQRGGDIQDLSSFSFTNNIVYFTVSPVQRPGDWRCMNNAGAPVACPLRFYFDSNLYWNPNRSTPVFTNTASMNPPNLSLAQWQSVGEDTDSRVLDPLFVNPSYPADNFALQAGSPAPQIAFTQFDANQAGRTTKLLSPPILPPAFPLQLLDPVKDFGQARSTSAAVSNASAASYSSVAFAPESIVSAFGSDLATGSGSAQSLPLPNNILGTQISVQDSTATVRPAPLFYVSAGQVNYQVPAGTSTGTATVTVTSGDGTVSTGTVNIATVAPGLFSANANGQGVAAALGVRASSDGTQTPVDVFQCSSTAGCTTAPIDLGADTDQVVLVLFGTGIRGRSALSTVSCRIGNADAPVAYAGPQPQFAGLDQVNVTIPHSLTGAGEVPVILTVDGQVSNTVTVRIK